MVVIELYNLPWKLVHVRKSGRKPLNGRQLIRKRQEIDAMKNVEEKNKALKAYAELLTSLEMGTFKGPTPTRQPSHTKKPFKIQRPQVARASILLLLMEARAACSLTRLQAQLQALLQ